ncbi:OmpP1/FadL family transporter [Tenacibaculum maritimum]|uniref:OmpP1/FadL family transporter n=1 Tax=Tenacibaculum maritimum TaxID=107401 RepID=UPI0012E6C099|nr:hemin receptor [Tenacibaculum maritimum]CAA0217259.1 putative outer membrane protein precursor [Tenacibaculum maritimum]
MRSILSFTFMIALQLSSFSQSLGYNDLGILFGTDNNYGTARFNAMSGAFGALGGDLSSTGINPAGGAVAKKSSLAITLGETKTIIDASYYGNSTNTQNNFFNISQAGGILSFDTAYDTNWNRFALFFNYRIKNDFTSNFYTQGNSGYALFNEHPEDITNQFDNAQEQKFSNNTNGNTSVFSVGFSAAHLNKLYIGASLNFHNLNFSQKTRLNEVNKDDNGNTLNASNEQNVYIEGNGVSLNFGFIYKLHQNFRFGLSYETPTWYAEVLEENDLRVFHPQNNRYDDWIGYTSISTTNSSNKNITTFDIYKEIDPDFIPERDFNSLFPPFRLRTPGKLTASSAFVFGKKGLISIDYTYKDYRNTRLYNGNFNIENQNFSNNFKASHAINIGTEWRFDNMSLRGGYHFENSPYKNALDSDNLKGFSAGLGYNFGNTKIDLSYSNSKYTSPYYIYDSRNANPSELTMDNSRITGTISFNI